MSNLFCPLNSFRIADLIGLARKFVCYTGPGVQLAPAKAMAEAAGRLGAEMVTVLLDFDERVMRMGFGDINAAKCLKESGIVIRYEPGLRTALVLVDDEGYIFTLKADVQFLGTRHPAALASASLQNQRSPFDSLILVAPYELDPGA